MLVVLRQMVIHKSAKKSLGRLRAAGKLLDRRYAVVGIQVFYKAIGTADVFGGHTVPCRAFGRHQSAQLLQIVLVLLHELLSDGASGVLLLVRCRFYRHHQVAFYLYHLAIGLLGHLLAPLALMP